MASHRRPEHRAVPGSHRWTPFAAWFLIGTAAGLCTRPAAFHAPAPVGFTAADISSSATHRRLSSCSGQVQGYSVTADPMPVERDRSEVAAAAAAEVEGGHHAAAPAFARRSASPSARRFSSRSTRVESSAISSRISSTRSAARYSRRRFRLLERERLDRVDRERQGPGFRQDVPVCRVRADAVERDRRSSTALRVTSPLGVATAILSVLMQWSSLSFSASLTWRRARRRPRRAVPASLHAPRPQLHDAPT